MAIFHCKKQLNLFWNFFKNIRQYKTIVLILIFLIKSTFEILYFLQLCPIFVSSGEKFGKIYKKGRLTFDHCCGQNFTLKSWTDSKTSLWYLYKCYTKSRCHVLSIFYVGSSGWNYIAHCTKYFMGPKQLSSLITYLPTTYNFKRYS